MKVSKKIINLESESAFAVLAKANKLISEGKDVINLGIGQPDFPTPINIQEAAIKAIKDGHHGYTPSNGIPQLREAVSEHIHLEYNVKKNPDEILITPGGKPTLLFLFPKTYLCVRPTVCQSVTNLVKSKDVTNKSCHISFSDEKITL